jgi:class 3 adenylate cyclase
MIPKKIVIFLLAFIIFLSLFTITNAKIVTSVLQEQYNLGEEINQNIKVITVENFKGFIRTTLDCENQQTLLFYFPVSLEANKEKVFSFSFQAKSPGKCFILTVLEQDDSKIEEYKSSTFIITDKINIQLTLNKQYFLPEEQLKITGTATMANGKSFSGAATITVDNQTYSTVVSRGFFSQTVLLSKTIAPGKQPVSIVLNDDENNIGLTSVNFEVGIVKSGLEITTNKEIIFPGELLLIKTSLLDQAGNTIPENISLKLIRIDNLVLGFQKRVFLIEGVVLSGSETRYKFPEDALPQDYLIEISSSGFSAEKTISVPAVESISYDLIDSSSGPTLIIKNTGNVKYQKPLEINLVLEEIAIKKIIDLDLDVGEEKTYPLNKINEKRPEGYYDLDIQSGNDTKNFSNVPITAKVSGSIVLSEGKQKNFWIYPLVLIILLAIVLIIIRRDFFLSIFKSFKSKPKRRIQVNRVYGFEVDREERPLIPVKESHKKHMSPAKEAYLSSSRYSSSPHSRVTPSNKSSRESFISSKSSPSNSSKEKNMKFSELTKRHYEQKKEIAASQDARMFLSKSSTLKEVFDKHASSLAAFRIMPTTVSGQKREVSVLMARISGLNSLMNIKNADTFLFNELANSYMSKIVRVVSQNSGVAELYDSNLVVFFNVTPTANHSMLAVKTAQGIVSATNEMNKELAVKGQPFQLSVSIGVHTGPVVANNIGLDKTLKYSPLSGTTSIAKALERKAFTNEIVVSQSVFNNLNNAVNTKKTTPVMSEVGAMNSYLVKAAEEAAKKEVPYWVK